MNGVGFSFPREGRLSTRTTTILISGLNFTACTLATPGSVHPIAGTHAGSLQTCRLNFGPVGLALLLSVAHRLGSNNEFQNLPFVHSLTSDLSWRDRQRGESMMPQGLLPYKDEKEKTDSGMTALSGLPVYLDLASVLNLGESISEHLHTKTQGWTDEQIILSLILLNLAGGECVDDLRILEADEGFCRILQRIELKGLPRKERRKIQRRWRKEKHRSVPSPSAVFRYLSAFREGYTREAGKAVIPPLTEMLSALERVQSDLYEESRSVRHPR